MSVELKLLHAECAKSLRNLERFFESHCKLTLLVRNPQAVDGDIVISSDDLDQVISSIEKLKEREPVK